MGAVGFGGASPFGSSTSTPMAVVASNNGKTGSGTINPNVLAQMATSPHSALGGCRRARRRAPDRADSAAARWPTSTA